MIAIKENAHKYEAEIKLCFNLLQDFLKDSFNDSDKERQYYKNRSCFEKWS